MKSFPSKDKAWWGFRYAISGLWYAIRTESHFRFHICAAIGTFMFTEYYDFTRYDYAFLALAIVLVFGAELVNTAIEHTVDLCTKEYSEYAKRAKDISAAFVLVFSIYALFTAALLFLKPKILFYAFLDMFTRFRYIAFFVLTILFVRGIGIKEKDNDR